MSALSRLREFFFTSAVEAVEVPIAKADGVPEMPATPVTEPVGRTGLAIVAGYVQSNERSADMIGVERYRRQDSWKREVAEVGLAMRDWLAAAGAPGWEVKPYQADDAEKPLPEDEARAAWLKRQLYGMATEWPRVVMEHSMSFLDGARVAAWTAKALPPGTTVGDQPAMFGLADIMTIPLATIERWDVDKSTGRLRGVVQRDPDTSAEIPIDASRLVYTRDLPTTVNPAGDGAMRFLAETIRRLQALEKLLDKSFEKDANGVPIIWAPVAEKMAQIGRTIGDRVYTVEDFAEDMQAAADFAAADTRNGAGIVLDSTPFTDRDGNVSSVRKYDAALLTANASSFQALTDRVKMLAWNVLAMLHAEHRAMGRDGGTQAMHLSKQSGQRAAVGAFLTHFASVVRNQIARPLWILNGFDPSSPADPQNLPALEWDALEFADNGSLVQSVSSVLTAAGVEPGRADDIVDAILANLGLPRLEELDDEALMMRRERALAGAGLPSPDATQDDLSPDEPAPGEE